MVCTLSGLRHLMIIIFWKSLNDLFQGSGSGAVWGSRSSYNSFHKLTFFSKFCRNFLKAGKSHIRQISSQDLSDSQDGSGLGSCLTMITGCIHNTIQPIPDLVLQTNSSSKKKHKLLPVHIFLSTTADTNPTDSYKITHVLTLVDLNRVQRRTTACLSQTETGKCYSTSYKWNAQSDISNAAQDVWTWY